MNHVQMQTRNNESQSGPRCENGNCPRDPLKIVGMTNQSVPRNGESVSVDVFEVIRSKYRKTYNTLSDNLADVAKELGPDQSFHTIDFGNILWKHQLWKENLPDISPHYAVKTNSNPEIIRLFVLLGYSFDCSTEGEMRSVLAAGADSGRILFAHTIKTPRALQFASTAGVDLLTFDNEEELLKIHKYHPNTRLLLRIKPVDINCLMDLSHKYGCDLSDAEKLLTKAKDLELNVTGVGFHVGGLCESAETYVETILNSRKVFDIAKRIGFSFTILDIGAGFMGKKGTDDLFCEYSRRIKESIEESFSGISLKIIAEPGTFYVASAVTLTTTIMGKRNIKAEKGGSIEKQYYLNDGVYGSFFHTIFAYDLKHHPVLDANELQSRSTYKSTLWGQTCCCEDVIVDSCTLPEMEIGELIVWTNIGAYSREACSTFTSVPLPAAFHVFVKDSRLKTEYIPNLEDVTNFIAKRSTLVLEDSFL